MPEDSVVIDRCLLHRLRTRFAKFRSSLCCLIYSVYSVEITSYVGALFTRIQLLLHAGLAYGNGCYFATQSSYSINGYSKPDASGFKYIYQARVLVGKMAPGQSGLKEPPQGFDSVGNAQMVIVFHDAQAYPEYLITFQ